MPIETGAPAPAHNRYGRICAEVYDLDKPVGALGDIGFQLAQLRPLDGPVLEPACGSGRLLIPLLEAGLDVDGFDPSAPMLAQCRARCAERDLSPRLWRAAFADFDPPRAYAAITVPVGSFLFAGDHAKGAAVLRRFHDALRPRGLLLIDLPPLGFLTDSMAAVRTWTAANGDLLRLTSRDVALDWIAQARTTHDVYERFRDGRLVETELEVMQYRAWSAEELTAALHAAGFPEVALTGAHKPRPPHAGDRLLTWTARRD